jgi:PAS domain S-box-containing protein
MYFNIKKKDAVNIFKIFLAAIIPVTIGIFLLVDYISGIEIETAKKLVVSEQKQKIDTVEYIVKSKIESNINDLMVIKDSQEMYGYKTEESKETQKDLAELFVRISKNKSEFDQIRIIDNDGDEVIKVNNRILKEPYIVHKSNLQGNQGRYFFQHGENLKEGQVYISPLDLTQIGEEIQRPYKPSMRFATPIFNENGEREYILVISYLAQNLLDVYDEYIGEQEFVDTMIVNKDGYYLSGDYRETFGFVIPGNEDKTLRLENSELWKKVKSGNNFEDYFTIDGINYCVDRITLSDIEKAVSPDNDYYIISYFENKYLPLLRTKSLINSDNMMVYLISVMFIGLFIISALYYYFNKNKENYNTVQMVADNSNDAVFVTDDRYIITYVNKTLEEMTGYKKEELIGKNVEIFKTKRHEQDFYRKIHRTVGEKGTWKGKIWNKRKDGMIFGSELTLIGENGSKGSKIKSYIGMLNDLADYEKNLNGKETLLNFDRQIFSEREYYLEELIQGTIKELDYFSIVYLYVKNNNILEITYSKKEYNEITTKLNENIKAIIGQENFLSKMSNSEYIFELRNIQEKRDIGIFMKEFFYRISKPIIYRNKEVFFDVKCGVAIYPESGARGRDLITNAKIAFHVLQDQNYDYQIYHRTSRDKLVYENKIDEKIKGAVKKQELVVFYQPQIDSITGKVIGGEALLRWDNEELGLVPPHLFIPAAEKNGSIIEIGNFVIQEVFKLLKSMEKHCGKNIPISINISPEQFKYKGLIENFKYLNKKYDIDFKNIKIEITEGMLVGSKIMINKKLQEFKELGMDIAVDDFGTGFSSLSYLKDLNVDELKIDREFIKNIPEKDDGSIARVVTSLGKNLNKRVVAEGVETLEQINFLKVIGCYKIQGYYYSRPLGKSEFINYACEKNN